jgi:hypothetical protein
MMKNHLNRCGHLPNFSIDRGLGRSGSSARLAALLLLGCGLISANAYANGEISYVSGKAQIISASKEVRSVSKGTRIIPGEILETGADGEIHAIMDDNTVLVIRPNSLLKIESYVANGDEKDHVTLSLQHGQLRAITGWVGKVTSQNYMIRTPGAMIGARETDHEVAVIEQGDEAGTYDKVNSGTAVIKTSKGDIAIQNGKAGFANKNVEQLPVVLASVPPFYQPAAHEDLVEKDKAEVEKTTAERLKRKRDDIRRQGGLNTQGNTKISDLCTQDTSAMNAFNEFLRAYEFGNTALIQNKLDPAMIGYQRFIDGVIQDNNRSKQLRVFLKDTQLQCGPDITVIQTLWEKRYLDVNTFQPGLTTGRSTILMHRDQTGWKFAAIAGDNLFVGPITKPAAFAFASPAVQAPSAIVTSAPVTISGITAPSPISIVGGTYSINGGPFTSAAGTVSDGQTVAVRVTSSGAQNGIVSATLTIGGVSAPFTVTTWDNVPNPLPNFNNGTETSVALVCAPLISNALTVTGITTPISISVSGSSAIAAYSINGGAFTSIPGTINNNDQVRVRADGNPPFLAPVLTVRATLLVGASTTATFSILCN